MNKIKFLIAILFLLLLVNGSLAQGVSINTSNTPPDGSAMLDVSSDTLGVLIPRITLVQRNDISNPTTGLLIYQTDNTPGFYYYNGSSWEVIGSGSFAIDNLYDGKTTGNNLFLGLGAGVNDDGINNANVAIGKNALKNNTSGSWNTATGYRALFSNTAGEGNVAYGHRTNYFNEQGNYNTIIGFRAGRGSLLHSKSGNVFIGYEAGDNDTTDNKLYIENSNADSAHALIYGEFDNDILVFNAKVGVGTISPLAKLHVDDTNAVLFSGTFGAGEIPVEGAGTRMLWYPAKAAFRVGSVADTQWNDVNIGNYSIGLGKNSMVSGNMSVALGNSETLTTARNALSAMGGSAADTNAISMGDESQINGQNSIGLGYYSYAAEDNTLAIGGHSTTCNYEEGTAVGCLAQTWYAGSSAFGRYANAYGLRSTAVGVGAAATGDSSTVIGPGAAHGHKSVALGNSVALTTARNALSAIGGSAADTNAISMGENSEATGQGSIAIGVDCIASGQYANSIGSDNNATGDYSTAMGHETDAQSYMSFAIGRFNAGGGSPSAWVETDPLFEIGKGTSQLDSANAFTVLKNGYTGIGTISPTALLDIRSDSINGAAVLNLGNSDVSHKLTFFPGCGSDPNPFIRWKAGDPLRFSTDEGGWSEKMRIASDGKVGIGTTTPTHKLHVYTDSESEIAFFENESTSDPDGIVIRTGPDANPGDTVDFVKFRDGDSTVIGSIDGDGTGGVNYNTTSDARLKTNIRDFHGGLKTLNQIKVSKYEMKSAPGIEKIGLIAQELQVIYPQAVSGSPGSDVNEDPMMVDYRSITPLLISATQELHDQTIILAEKTNGIDDLKNDMESVKEEQQRIGQQLDDLSRDVQMLKSFAKNSPIINVCDDF